METAQIILSIVTAAAAIIALFLTLGQIHISNKQALFERRLKVYLTVKWMATLCHDNQAYAPIYNEIKLQDQEYNFSSLFDLMCQSSFLEGVEGLLNAPIDSNKQKEFTLKIERLRELFEESTLVFPETIGRDLSDFIYYYEEMLFAMFKYAKVLELKHNSDTSQHERLSKLEHMLLLALKKFVPGTFELANRVEGYLVSAKKKMKL